jgi:Zn-dependent M28 family amino/carboxypeptidase
MRRYAFALAALAAAAYAGPARCDEAASASVTRLRAHVEYLASDELEGRAPGTDGIDLAADYIAEEFARIGLKTDLASGPFQTFTLSRSKPANPDRPPRPLKNVIALLPGSGKHSEVLVLGAHYDHLGRGGLGSLAPWTVEIHNGADDNASGTATLLEVARLLAARPRRLERSILFIAFSAEERGLIGSEYYARRPVVSLNETAAMLNLDMVGRLRQDRLTVYGVDTAKEFRPLMERLSAQHPFELRLSGEGYGPSDHASFYARGVPVLHFFTGYHADYHRPSDDADTLNYEGMARIAELVAAAMVDLADAPARPTPQKSNLLAGLLGGGNVKSSPDAGTRPLLGVLRSEPAPEGLAIHSLVPRGPAQNAGVRAGDLLLEAGESRPRTHRELIDLVRSKSPGDKLPVRLRRGDVELLVEVTLGRF